MCSGRALGKAFSVLKGIDCTFGAGVRCEKDNYGIMKES